MNRALRASLVFALLSTACQPEESGEEKPAVDLCTSLTPLSLSADRTRLRVNESLVLKASGGSGYYRYRAEPGGSSGQLNGSNFVAGATPGTDTLVAEDQRCPGDARLQVEVVAGFGVAPSRASVKPGTSFQVQVSGLLGSPVFTLTDSPAGSTLSPTGLYTAGAKEGLDLIQVRDSLKGDVVLLRFDVRASAALRGDPAYLVVPAGSSLPLATADGTDQVRWSKRAGPGSVSAGRFQVGANETGTAELLGTDPFTRETTTVFVRVAKELTRDAQAHGQLTDLASVVTADFDGDGVLDVAVGRPESDLARPKGGAVFIFKGSAAGLPSEPTWVLKGESDAASFGDTVLAGDLDGDGRPELAVGSPGAALTIGNSGAVYLYRFGPNGPEPLGAPLSNTGRGTFGTGLALADLDGDGDLDIIVGSPAADLAPTTTVFARGVLDLFLNTPGQPIPAQSSIRLGGINLDATGKLEARRSTDLGRAIAVGDFNDDGLPDVAALSRLWRYDTGNTDKVHQAVAVYFGRGGAQPFVSSPDLFVTPSAYLTDGNEGLWKLAVLPKDGGRPPMLMVVADRSDSPNLTAKGGLGALTDAGAVLLFDLSTYSFKGDPSSTPVQVKRDAAWAQLYGDTANGVGGRGFAVMDVDGVPGPELLLGIPYASPVIPPGTTTVSLAGKVIVHPLATLKKGDQLNKPLQSLTGSQRSDIFGVALAPWTTSAGAGFVTFAARASAPGLAFTGRVDAFIKAGDALTSWSRTSAMAPARPSVERYGEVVAVAPAATSGAVALVGSPGWSGPGGNLDGNEMAIGKAWALGQDAAMGTSLAEGASSPLVRGRNVGVDVAFTDFNKDGIADAVMGASGFIGPGTNARTAEIAPYYAKEDLTCLLPANQGSGGVLVSLGQPDGSFKSAYRLWAQGDIAGCSPAGTATCQRRGIGRGVVGGFDFNGDGTQDIGALRNNGLEVFLGRPPDDATLAKLTMVCAPAYTAPYTAQQTSAPVALGDLNGDGCDELAWRYADGSSSGVIVLFGADSGGARCRGRREPVQLWLSDKEALGNFLGLGLATTRAGRLLGKSGPDFIAHTATAYPYEGLTQQVVLLTDTAKLLPELAELDKALAADNTLPRRRVLKASDFVEAVLVPRSRAVGFGTVLRGNVDVSGDGVPDLVVSAPGASVASDGGGAVFIYAGGPNTKGALAPWLTLTGDVGERANFGQSVALMPASGDKAKGTWRPPTLAVGAPQSYRAGTQNGTAFLVPLDF
jgi:hypothetical protein